MNIDNCFARYIFLVALALFLGISSLKAQTDNTIQVVAEDAQSGEPVVGATIKSGEKWYVTGDKGACDIPRPKGNVLKLTVKVLGYVDVLDSTIRVAKGWQRIVVKLKPSNISVGEVKVGAKQRATSKLQQSVAIETEVLEKSASLSIGQLLEQVPGVSTISTGSTIYKPVIQGMHSSRVLLINNGVKLESQSWGEDHAPEIDHTGSSVVEVVKGAEAVRYGYGAVGGVVIFSQAPLPFGHDHFKVGGKANLGYALNGHGYDGSGSIEMGYKWIGLRLHGMYQRTGDYRTAKYILNNTGLTNINLSAHVGARYKNFTATLYSSLYTSWMGIYYGSKVSDIDQLLKRFIAGQPDEHTFKPFSYKVIPPFQQVQHFMAKSDFVYRINDDHKLELTLSYQDNLRQEYENRKQERYSWLPVQDLQLTSMNGELVWNGNWSLFNMSSQLGITGMYQYNFNVPGTKTPAFIPNYAALTMGGFLFHKVQFGNLTCSAGMRLDLRAMDVKGYTTLSSFKYYGGFRIYMNFTGTFAFHYQFNENIEARANLGWAWRPPDVNEMFAAGLHHGIYWVVGNKGLKSEHGYKAVAGAKYHNSWLVVEPSVFFQYIDNYIYDNIGEGRDRFHNHPSGKFPKFVYEQDNSRFFGGDVTLSVVPYTGLTLSAKGEWINARNLRRNTWLPFMPSDRYGLGANYTIAWGDKQEWHADVSLEGMLVTKQKRFDASKDLVPDSPPAYFLLKGSAEVGRDLPGGRSVRLMLLGDNILNALYKEYTDRFRYYAHARGAQLTIRTLVNF